MRSSRLLLITILATGGFYVAGFVALGSGYPTAESTGGEIVQWFTDHGSNARFYAWTAAFVSLGLGIFGGQVSALFPKPHRYIFLAGVLGFAITAQVQAWFWAGLALHPEGLDPGAARTIFDIPNYWGPLVNGSTTAMAIAVVALGLGASPLVPRWLTWLSAVFFRRAGHRDHHGLRQVRVHCARRRHERVSRRRHRVRVDRRARLLDDEAHGLAPRPREP